MSGIDECLTLKYHKNKIFDLNPGVLLHHCDQLFRNKVKTALNNQMIFDKR